MIRTLFVDDEVDVLEGLENRLRRMRRRWKMAFAVGGQQALEKLGTDRFDVIVSDMRMPGMDGAELLTKVRATYPHMVRIVLSGQTKKEQVLRALPVAHQFLSKPCDTKLLEQAVERSRSLQQLIQSDPIREILASVDCLPSLPEIYTRLTEAVDQPHASVDTLADIVKEDIAMTARILQVANSSFFGLAREVTEATDAISYLGINAVRSIVLTAKLFEALDHGATLAGFSLELLQRHSLRAAHIASRLLSDEDDKRIAFSAAMLHDVGSLLLSTACPEFYDGIADNATRSRDPLFEMEKAAHGYTHAEVGAALLALWGLPYAVVEGVAYHHRPSQSQESEFGVVGAVHLADQLAHETQPSGDGSGSSHRTALDQVYIEKTGIAERLNEWRTVAREATAG